MGTYVIEQLRNKGLIAVRHFNLFSLLSLLRVRGFNLKGLVSHKTLYLL